MGAVRNAGFNRAGDHRSEEGLGNGLGLRGRVRVKG